MQRRVWIGIEKLVGAEDLVAHRFVFCEITAEPADWLCRRDGNRAQVAHAAKSVGVGSVEGRARFRARVQIIRRLPRSAEKEAKIVVDWVRDPLPDIGQSSRAGLSPLCRTSGEPRQAASRKAARRSSDKSRASPNSCSAMVSSFSIQFPAAQCTPTQGLRCSTVLR